MSNDQTHRASRTKTLWGTDGAGDAVAERTVRVSEAGAVQQLRQVHQLLQSARHGGLDGKLGHGRLFVRSQFWQDADKERLMQKTCEAAGGTFVNIGKLGFDEANCARAERKIEHAGVAGHLGDKGMQTLADALWSAIQEQAQLPTI